MYYTTYYVLCKFNTYRSIKYVLANFFFFPLHHLFFFNIFLSSDIQFNSVQSNPALPCHLGD